MEYSDCTLYSTLYLSIVMDFRDKVKKWSKSKSFLPS